MSDAHHPLPALRPLDVRPIRLDGQDLLLIEDRTGLAESPMVISQAGALILVHLDGRHGVAEIREQFRLRIGSAPSDQQISDLVEALDENLMLDSPRFQAHYQELVAAYAAAAVRESRPAEGYGTGAGGLGELLAQLMPDLRETALSLPARQERLVGLVAPHLDYQRGAPCYVKAYAELLAEEPARRYVILGTNHFGQATGMTATGKDFATPLGTVPTDRDFIARLEQRCGATLREGEYDHLREHSVELQVVMLQHLFPEGGFSIVPVLCHDPCGPTRTMSYEGRGVGIKSFAEHLQDLLEEDDVPTVLIAGADLSHVGRNFGDECELDEPFLERVRDADREALRHLIDGDGEGFVTCLTERANDTRICSGGCLYGVRSALPRARAALIGYHQAVDRETGTGVTCAALTFRRP